MQGRNRVALLIAVVSAFLATIAFPSLAQQKPAPIAPAAPLKDGWEEIDQRLVFLMVRLANTEASLDAVEKTLGITTRQVSSSVADAKRAEQGNEKMDRQGGGPMRWSEFYGRTALEEMLAPLSLTYEVEGETVRLKRK